MKNDTVEYLKYYTEAMGVNDDYWSFLTGYGLDEITRFAEESFKSPVKKLDDDYLHSTRFFLVNENGEVIRAYNGMATDLSDIKNDTSRTVQ
ncbi:SCO family protein [Oceanobacillus sp. 1P07AA]|nr:SCO family protein [Oceanobacillus kimchii]